MAEFITLCPPPGQALANYNRSASYNDQPKNIPATFTEAMSIREAVYVDEQEIPLENEFDFDDARSWHWVVYASVGQSSSNPSRRPSNPPPTDPKAKRGSTASRTAVGTIRLVPPPHPPHPHANSEHKIDNIENEEKVPLHRDAKNKGPKSGFNPHNEPYIKLGRLAVLPEFRGLGLAKLLVDTALGWASKSALQILPPPNPMAREQARIDGLDTSNEAWKGLILVHAQKTVIKVWAMHGFKVDEALGEWLEEGIPHVAMWRKIKLKERGDRD